MFNNANKQIGPLVALYAITAGEEVFVDVPEGERRFKFDYNLFGIYNGFDVAQQYAAPTLARNFVDMGDLRGPAQPTVVTHSDDGDTTLVELFHPSYSPFDAGVPLMFISLVTDEQPAVETITRFVTKKKVEEPANG